jgi:hypothetical protein
MPAEPPSDASAGGIQVRRNFEVSGTRHEIAGRDLVKTNVEQVVLGHVGARWQYQRDFTWLIDGTTRFVVGRERALSQIISMVTRAEPGYVLVQAPAGYGKTTVVVELIRRLRSSTWTGPRLSLIYYFIREEEQQHKPEAFLLGVNSQLLDLCGRSEQAELEPIAQRAQFAQLWADAVENASASQPLLFMVDGLDEMANDGDSSIARLLPGSLRPDVHVLITSRPSPAPLAQVPLEHPLRDALLIGLDDLSTEHLVELLVEYGASAELAEQLGGRLRTLTRGEPLFARFVCHDVARGGEQALATLERESPQGVRDYFSWQLLQLKSRASRDGNVAWSLLELLVAARGGMTPQELADVLDVPSHVVDSTLKPLRRFLQGAPR